MLDRNTLRVPRRRPHRHLAGRLRVRSPRESAKGAALVETAVARSRRSRRRLHASGAIRLRRDGDIGRRSHRRGRVRALAELARGKGTTAGRGANRGKTTSATSSDCEASLAQAPSERLVLMGDFNQKIAEPGRPQSGAVGQRATLLQRAIPGGVKVATDEFVHEGRRPIDHIALSANLRPRELKPICSRFGKPKALGPRKGRTRSHRDHADRRGAESSGQHQRGWSRTMREESYRAWLERRGLAESSVGTYVIDGRARRKVLQGPRRAVRRGPTRRVAQGAPVLRRGQTEQCAESVRRFRSRATRTTAWRGYRSTVTRYREYREAEEAQVDPVEERVTERQGRVLGLERDLQAAMRDAIRRARAGADRHRRRDRALRELGVHRHHGESA